MLRHKKALKAVPESNHHDLERKLSHIFIDPIFSGKPYKRRVTASSKSATARSNMEKTWLSRGHDLAACGIERLVLFWRISK
jgi:hypothetical protein